jgi:hypothetical protein
MSKNAMPFVQHQQPDVGLHDNFDNSQKVCLAIKCSQMKKKVTLGLRTSSPTVPSAVIKCQFSY